LHGFTVQHLSDMINNLFSIPVWKKHLDVSCDIENDLLNQIEKNYEQNNPHLKPDNWNCIVHSSKQKHNNINYDQVIPLYKKEYENFVSEQNLNLFNHNYWIQNPWYNYYVKHSNQEIHSHIKLTGNYFPLFSGVHFLKLNKDHSRLSFYNPNQLSILYNDSNFFKNNIKSSFSCIIFEPDIKQGDIIIFPSFLEHAVFPQKIDDPRITISFNIMGEIK